MSDRTLSWEELQLHLEQECLCLIDDRRKSAPDITSVAIRSGEGIDFGVAAVHREGDVLIFDMGHALEEIP